ncbi:[protein-PII] uridylyltransferase [Magnetococcales bacterium HHB-1]
MSQSKKKFVFDPTLLEREVSELLKDAKHAPFSDEMRPKLVALFKRTLEKGQKRLRQYHLQGVSGKFIVSKHSLLMDHVLIQLFNLTRLQHVIDHEKIDRSTVSEERKKPAGISRPKPLFQRLREAIRRRRARNADKPGQICLIATGGYGRQELAPFSDIDLLFLFPSKLSASLGLQVERMLYFLWDLGLDVGHAVRSVEECVEQAKDSLEIRTALLESRLLAGDDALYKRYKKVLSTRILRDPELFLKEKIAEQEERRERFGNSLFYLEPNIKENPGGLRDIHTFFWISKYRYRVDKVKELVKRGVLTREEYRTFIRARKFLWRVRNALHYQTGRREDRLTFSHQLNIAKEFEYQDRVGGMKGVEIFMRRYYQAVKQVGSLSDILLQQYQAENREDIGKDRESLERGFCLYQNQVTFCKIEAFAENPINMIRLFEIAQRYKKMIHPEALRMVTRNLNLVNRDFRRHSEVRATFLKMLNGTHAVAQVLRRMNTTGFLARLIPEFGRITGQTQHDMFHIYTVDEHSILAVENLRFIKKGKLANELPISTKVISKLNNSEVRVLYIAVLLHDIAKGRGGLHEVKGAEMAKPICIRLGLSRQETDLVVWLVRYHLIFSRSAFRHDVNDPQTIYKFTSQVDDKQKLDLLLLLTVADIRAVGPGIWNQWKASLLRQLYYNAEETLNKGRFDPNFVKQRAEKRQEAFIERLIETHPAERSRRYLERFYPDYLLSYKASELVEHFLALEFRINEPLSIIFHAKPESDATNLMIYTQDHHGLIARISGALASEGVSILSANAHTTKDGMVLDVFKIQDQRNDAIESLPQLQRIEKTLKAVLTCKSDPARLLKQAAPRIRKQDHFKVPTQIVVDNEFSTIYTVLEVTALDRIGLLYTITQALESLGIQIRTAKIATYGERAVDVFYIKDLFGMKLDERKVERVKRLLIQSIDELTEQHQSAAA